MKKWEISTVREKHAGEISSLSADLGVSALTGALLYQRGLVTSELARAYIDKQTEAFYDPFLMRDMDRAVSGIEEAVSSGKRIVIYGDYDVDGVTSVSVLYLYLKNMGADIDYYIPSRSGEGYGVNTDAIDTLASSGVSLIITVDTGITAIDEIEYAKGLGIDFIVTDHHTCHSEIPEAIAVINPHRPDCGYPFKDLAGVGVVFKLICALEKKRTGCADASYIRNICDQYADLVAIGTVADVMPLCDENRLIVSVGLERIKHTERPGLAALMAMTSQNGKEPRVNSSYIGFTIAPRINAAGRIGNASRAARLFLTDDMGEAQTIAEELCDTNKTRQHEENAIVEEALQKISEDADFENRSIIVLSEEGWHQGVIGIVASRLTEKYGLPSILISFEGDTGKGSGRSVKGINLVGALGACSDLLIKYGGHELAAGLSISRENLPEFTERIDAYVKERASEKCEDILEIECIVKPEEITVRNASEIALLEPFGTDNPEPVVVLEGATIAEAKPIGAGKHTKLVFEKNGIHCDAVYFNCNIFSTNFYVGDTVDVAFRLSVNDFMGNQSAQMIVRDMRLCAESADFIDRGRALYSEIKAGRKISDDENIIPVRDDFAAVYRYIKNEVRRENDIIGVKGITRRLPGMNYVKVRYIIEIFREVNIIGIVSYGTEPDIYKFKLNHMTAKINLDKSSIYKKLKSRKEYHQN